MRLVVAADAQHLQIGLVETAVPSLGLLNGDDVVHVCPPAAALLASVADGVGVVPRGHLPFLRAVEAPVSRVFRRFALLVLRFVVPVPFSGHFLLLRALGAQRRAVPDGHQPLAARAELEAEARQGTSPCSNRRRRAPKGRPRSPRPPQRRFRAPSRRASSCAGPCGRSSR